MTDFRKLKRALKRTNSTFNCGGSVLLHEPLQLYYRAASDSDSAHVVEFPVKNDAAFAQLLNACAPASFGRGTEAVMDTTYRDALKLDRSQFSTTLNIASTSILEEIRRIMVPESDSVQAELYALNIYGPGGHFKAHVDTPRSEQMFGSLVVALPCTFEGGALVVKHDNSIAKFCWGDNAENDSQIVDIGEPTECEDDDDDDDDSDIDDTDADDEYERYDEYEEEKREYNFEDDDDKDSEPAGEEKGQAGPIQEPIGRIHWAAFYSDCEHEIKEVRSGYRVTVTYNLMHGPNVLKFHSMDVTRTPLYKQFREVLASENFLETGGTIGVYCKHAYAHTSKQAAKVPTLLKGIDALVVAVARALGLKVQIRPYYEIREEESIHQFMGRKFVPVNVDERIFGDWYYPIEYANDALGFVSVPEIHWLQRMGQKEVAAFGAAHGNQPSVEVIYSKAAIFITVPSYEDRQGEASHQENA